MSFRTIIVVSAIAGLSAAVAMQTMERVLASDVAANLTKQTGIGIYLESRAAKERIDWTPSKEPVTPDKLQAEIERLAKALPKGADWGVLYLPPPPEGKVWKGDDVLAYARAQAGLYGKVGTVEAGSVEILSKKLPVEQSKPILQALNLKPIYILALGKGTFAGVWKTTFGEMRLSVNGNRVNGTYSTGSGQIGGVVSDGVLTFNWFETVPGQGGGGVFRLSEDGDSFTGEWWNDGVEGQNSTWTGTRVSR